MLDPKKIERINELARKKKIVGLTQVEQDEQLLLRQEYLEAFRGGMRNHIEGLKVVDEDGNDVTPEKLKQRYDSYNECGCHSSRKFWTSRVTNWCCSNGLCIMVKIFKSKSKTI